MSLAADYVEKVLVRKGVLARLVRSGGTVEQIAAKVRSQLRIALTSGGWDRSSPYWKALSEMERPEFKAMLASAIGRMRP